jgi:hypothetical protein
MKNFAVRSISGFLILLFLLYIAPILGVQWVMEGNFGRALIVPIAVVGGWGSLYLYRFITKDS